MKVLITGGHGMLGRTLRQRLTSHELCITDLPEVDITKLDDIEKAVAFFQPMSVVHCAAMTAVDACESDHDKAFAVNAVGSANVAIACQRHGARLLAISTDYVFCGDLDRPYHEWDKTGPRTVYGASKLAGEQAVCAHCPDHAILRTAWLYGPGGPSFYHAMLRAGALDNPPAKVVSDQVGNPTSTDALAAAINLLLEHPLAGTFHVSCEGEASWFEFAQEIFRLHRLPRALVPCETADFPRPAPRPPNSRLEKRALRLQGLPTMPHWKDALAQFVREQTG